MISQVEDKLLAREKALSDLRSLILDQLSRLQHEEARLATQQRQANSQRR